MRSETTDAVRRRVRIGVGAALTLLIGAFALVVGSGMLRGGMGVEPVPLVSASASPGGASIRAGTLYVHVAGAVRTPGLYVLDAGARVVDAVAAAGGLADDAEPSALNLARLLADGEHMVVPRQGDVTAEPAAGGAGASDGTVDLNKADAAALDTLPRVGPAIAQRIVEWREQNGPFTSVDDLLAVPGIGEKMLAGLRDRVRV